MRLPVNPDETCIEIWSRRDFPYLDEQGERIRMIRGRTMIPSVLDRVNRYAKTRLSALVLGQLRHNLVHIGSTPGLWGWRLNGRSG